MIVRIQMEESKRPNVIFIMADQLRWDALGAHTPTINQLISESVLFNDAYCASPLCVPARGAFFTGCYPNRTGCLINPWEPLDRTHGYVHAGTPNLYSWFEKTWDSHHVGKQHFRTADNIDTSPETRTHWDTLTGGYQTHLRNKGVRAPGGGRFKGIIPEMAAGRFTRARTYSIPAVGEYEPGFEHFYDGYIAGTALSALRRRDPDKPLLLNAMFLAPHPPYDIPEPWFSMIKDVDLPKSVGTWYPDQSPLQLYNLTGAIGVRYSREDWMAVWRVYLGLVALLDHSIKLIIDELKRQDIYDDSLIVFCSDHGEMLGSHMLYQKMCMYQPSVHTPIGFKLPASSAYQPGTVNGLVSAVDVFPTICELTGMNIPSGIDGRSLVPMMSGDSAGRDAVFIQFDGNGARGNFQRAIIRGNHKLIVDMFKDEVFLELYDLVSDPEETANLAFDPEHRARLTTMLNMLSTHMTETGDLLSVSDDTVDRFIQDYSQFRR